MEWGWFGKVAKWAGKTLVREGKKKAKEKIAKKVLREIYGKGGRKWNSG